MRDAGRFDRCADETEITRDNLTGEIVITWCTGGAITDWDKWIKGMRLLAAEINVVQNGYIVRI